MRLRQVIPSTYCRYDNKLGRASALDLMKALPLNSDKGCTSVLCSEGVEICHPTGDISSIYEEKKVDGRGNMKSV